MSKSKQGQDALPAKDQANYKQALKLYESKQYKKALKSADMVLKKNPEHGETLAIKGLILYFLEKKEEGHDYIKKGLSKHLNSFVNWHIHGIYHKQERNYEEATKCFNKALQLDAKNPNLLRELSQLQMQTRQFAPLVTTRSQVVLDKPGFRLNWNGLAIAQFLTGDFAKAEKTCNDFESMLKEPLPKSDTENSEMMLFKNHVIYSSGDVQRALDNLDEIKDKALDQLAMRECRAKYLQELGRVKEAEREYRALIKRNPECVSYYLSLEETLGIKEDDLSLRKLLYERFAAKYPKADAPKSIPLEFLTGESFKQAAGEYLKGKLSRGVPSTFVMVKPLYANAEKRQAIHEFINEYYKTKQEDPATQLWTIYYMAQHYCHLREYQTALDYINEAIDHTPTLVELYMTKAKILKHLGNIVEASQVMNFAREIDLQDRFVNTKATKYMLRAGEMDKAIDTLSLFTRNDANGKGVQDLHDMQGVWFLNEQAESYARLGNDGLALKRFLATVKVYNEYHNDQYDFHYYCPRKGTLRAYLDMVNWEDKLYTDHKYIRAVNGAAKIYFKLANQLNQPEKDEFEGMDEAEKKKLLKKQKKERAKEFKKEQDEKEKSKDSDPMGRELLKTKTPIAELEKIWKPIGDQHAESALAWQISFDMNLRLAKYPMAVSSLVKARNFGAPKSWLVANSVLSRYMVENDEEAPAALRAVPLMTLPQVATEGNIAEDNLSEYADKYIIDDTARSVLNYCKVKKIMGEPAGDIMTMFDKTIEIEDALDIIEWGQENGVNVEKFIERAQQHWPQATVFTITE